MATRAPMGFVAEVVADLRHARGRRLRHAVVWRARRARNRLRRLGTPPRERVYSVAFGPNGGRLLGLLGTVLPQHGIKYMVGGSSRPSVRMVHIDADDVAGFCRCLLEASEGIEILVGVPRKWREPLTEQTIARLVASTTAFDLLVVESTVHFTAGFDVDSSDVSQGSLREIFGERTHVQCSTIEVAVWAPQLGPHNAVDHEPNRTLPLVARVRSFTYEQMMSDAHDFDSDLPAPDAPRFEVDVVYTWVDGDDPEWQAEKDKYAEQLGRQPSSDRVLREERFRNRDELKYSLRSLDLFAPWVRRIHIVTAGQQPAWLDIDHPKINVVSHKDIYADPQWLPTFNSSGIETQLHHIPGLSKYFVYFNDDFFLGDNCDPCDFFHANGIIKYFTSTQRAYEPDIDHNSEEYIQADRNAIELLSRDFPSVGRSIMRHVPYPSNRDLLFELEGKYAEAFARCASSRFRSSNDLRPIAFMQYHYGYQERLAMEDEISHRYLALWKPAICDQLANVERRRAHKTFCINDVGLAPERTEHVNLAVLEFLEAYFPQPSQFERPA